MRERMSNPTLGGNGSRGATEQNLRAQVKTKRRENGSTGKMCEVGERQKARKEETD